MESPQSPWAICANAQSHSQEKNPDAQRKLPVFHFVPAALSLGIPERSLYALHRYSYTQKCTFKIQYVHIIINPRFMPLAAYLVLCIVDLIQVLIQLS